MAPWRLPSAALAVALPLIAVAAVGTPHERATPTSATETANDRVQGRAAPVAMPIAFEPSGRGFRSRGPGYDLFLQSGSTTLVLQRGAERKPVTLRSTLVGARTVRPTSEARLPGIVNVYRGDRWRERIPTYGRIRYASVYPGVDAVYHGRQSALEYDFEVQPGASPSQILLSHAGARSTSIARNGDLLHHMRDGVVRERRPIAYQVVDGRRVAVDASYRRAGKRVGFEVGSYDRGRKLVIDPVLSYSSYLAGSNEDYVAKIAVGTDKSVYITGRTLSNDLAGATRAGNDLDAFVTKLAPDGSRVYTTYFGAAGLDQAFDVASDSSGRAYVVGNTDSNSDTLIPFALDSCLDGQADAFILRLNTNGTRSYASCLGGDGLDNATGVAVRENGGTPEAYVVGDMPQGFGTYPSSGVNGQQTSCCTGKAIFFARISFGASVSIPYLTYIDGSSTDDARAVAVDPSGNAYVAGRSVSTSIGGIGKPSASSGVFVMKINPATTGAASRIYTTWIDGSSAEDVGAADSPPYVGGSIAVNSSGVAYVGGSTGSSDLPAKVTSDTFKFNASGAGYISVVGSGGSVLRTIYVDGSDQTTIRDLALQEIGGVTSVYAIGDTEGTIGGVNTLSGQSCANASPFHPDALLLKFVDGPSPQAVYITCLGAAGDDTGLAIAPGPGNDATAWIAGTTTGSFPTVNAHQPDAGAVTDGFVARISQHPAAIDSGPEGSIPTRSATFTFSTSGSGLTFACSVPEGGRLVPGGALGPCSASVAYADLADGEHTFEVATVDAAGAQSARTSRTFSVNTAAPSAAYVIAPNPVLIGRPASFDAASSSPAAEPIVRYEWDLDGDGSFETDGGGSPTTTTIYGVAGTVNTALRVTDAAGASGIARVALVVTDPNSRTAQVGVTINKGAQYTNKPDVTLSIVAPAATTAMLISNDGGFLGALPQPATTTVNWKLDSSGPERLPKTVYVRFLTGSFASPNYTDDIILDETPPKVRTAVIAPAAAARAVASARARRYRIRVRATDSNSGVATVQVTAKKRRPGKAIRYKRRLTVKAKARPKFLRARDRAGNFSRWKKLR